MARTKIVSLAEHPLEEHTMSTLSTDLPYKPHMLQLTLWLIEVYVENFIGMAQNPSIYLLKHIYRSILVSIHEVLCASPHVISHGGGLNRYQKSP